MNKTLFGTVVTKSFLPEALCLYRSLIRHNPRVRFRVLVCDARAEELRGRACFFPDGILAAEELKLGALERLRKTYSPFELCNVLRPFLIQHLLDLRPACDAAVYLDADLYITGVFRRSDLFSGGRNAACALTPHVLKPYPVDQLIPGDDSLLCYGFYNSGFQVFRNNAASRRLLKWLQQRISLYGFNAPPLFYVDQKLLPLMAEYFPGDVRCLRHPGYNIAYWNLHEREIREKDGRFFSNKHPAVFFHFSGFDLNRPREWTQRGKRRRKTAPAGRVRFDYRPANPALKKVLSRYSAELESCGREMGILAAGRKSQRRISGKALKNYFRRGYHGLLRETASLRL